MSVYGFYQEFSCWLIWVPIVWTLTLVFDSFALCGRTQTFILLKLSVNIDGAGLLALLRCHVWGILSAKQSP